MIELINVSKYYPTEFGRHYVFRNVSLQLPLDKSVGVLGPNGAGKSTFLRLLGGADIPSEGKIIKTGLISPPMGLTPGLQSSLTAAENARFAGRIHGLSRDEIADMIEHVRELSDIGKFFDLSVGTYSAGMKQRVAFAINMSINFDYYLFDEIGAGGDREFRKTAKTMVEQRIKTSKFIIASHRVDELLDVCDSGIVIQNGELAFFDDIKDALEAYGETEDGEDDKPARPARRRRRRDATDVPPKTDAVAGLPTADAADPETPRSRVERPRAEREQRRQARKTKQAKAAETASSGEAVAAAPDVTAGEATGPALASPIEPRVARPRSKRERRRQERLQARQGAAAGTASQSSESAQAVVAPGQVAQAGETGSDRAGRIRARRERAANERLQRRRARAADRDGGETTARSGRPVSAEIAASAEKPMPAVAIAASVPAETAEAPGRGERKRDARRPATGKRRERIARRCEARDKRTNGKTAPARPTLPEAASGLPPSRSPLLQQRAQVKSARAIRMLLQHLESQPANNGSPQAKARAALVAAAQDAAAAEAAIARAGLETYRPASHGDTAPPPTSPARRDNARQGHSDN